MKHITKIEPISIEATIMPPSIHSPVFEKSPSSVLTIPLLAPELVSKPEVDSSTMQVPFA